MKRIYFFLICLCFIPTSLLWAKDDAQNATSSELVTQGWVASSQRKIEELDKIVTKCEQLYGDKAKEQEASLAEFPTPAQFQQYHELNDAQ